MFFHKISSLIHHFKKCERGVSHIEFAFCVPVLLTLVIGSTVTFDYFWAKQKTITTADALADVTARLLQINQAEAESLFTMAESMMGKYHSRTTISGKITGLVYDEIDNVLRPEWSYGHNDVPPDAMDMEFPATDYPSLTVDTMLIVAEVSFKYKSSFVYNIFDFFHFQETSLRTPRYASRIPIHNTVP